MSCFVLGLCDQEAVDKSLRRILGHQELLNVEQKQINCPFYDVTGARAGVVTAMRLAIVQTIPGTAAICTILNSPEL